MIQVPEEIKQLYMQDSIPKNFRVSFPNGEHRDLVNDDMVSESVVFTESINSTDGIKFGLCEGSTLEFQTYYNHNIRNLQIKAGIEIDVTSLLGEISNYQIELAYSLSSMPYTAPYTGTYEFTVVNLTPMSMKKYLDAGEEIDLSQLINPDDAAVTPVQFSVILYKDVNIEEVDIEQSSDVPYPYYYIPYGYFFVDSCKRDGHNNIRTVVAYQNNFNVNFEYANRVFALSEFEKSKMRVMISTNTQYTEDLVKMWNSSLGSLLYVPDDDVVTVREGFEQVFGVWSDNFPPVSQQAVASGVISYHNRVLYYLTLYAAEHDGTSEYGSGNLGFTSYTKHPQNMYEFSFKTKDNVRQIGSTIVHDMENFNYLYRDKQTGEVVPLTTIFSHTLEHLDEFIPMLFGFRPSSIGMDSSLRPYDRSMRYTEDTTWDDICNYKDSTFVNMYVNGTSSNVVWYPPKFLPFKDTVVEGNESYSYLLYPNYSNIGQTDAWYRFSSNINLYVIDWTYNVDTGDISYGETRLLSSDLSMIDLDSFKLVQHTFSSGINLTLPRARTSVPGSPGITGYAVPESEIVKLNTAWMLDISNALFELQGKFARINRETNNVELIDLFYKKGLYPSPDLYPQEQDLPETLYPQSPSVLVARSLWYNVWYDDLTIQHYKRVFAQWKDSNNVEQFVEYIIIPEEEIFNPEDYVDYDISSNYFIQNNYLSVAQVQEVVGLIGKKLENIIYYPADIEMRGLPFLEAGDSVSVVTKDSGFSTFAFRHRISGIQALTDNIEAR